MTTRTSVLDSSVFGVDVQSGDVRGDAPSYALVALDEQGGETDGVSVDRDVVSRRKLRRLIERDEPAIVATDNVYELAADADDLVHLLRWLPDGTRLVQVTGGPQPEPLSRVANRHGVPYGKEPMQEAEAAARLAAANVGQVVSAFANRTEVKVARGRSTGGGGWSQDRYTRRIHGSVKRRAREVERAIDEAGLAYERDVTEKYGGYANAVFEVEAAPDAIPVSTGRAGDTRVEMEQERRDGIEFEPLAERRDRVVVGIDPGTTTAAAVVSLDGEVLDRLSTRTADRGDLIEWLVERGRPVLVAADVTPMPDGVEAVRRSFDAAGWTPETDLPVDEKLHRTREVPHDNDHERDAAAAALLAVDDHEDQFERIAAKTPPEADRGEVVEQVLGSEMSVEAVLSELGDTDEGDPGREDNDDHEPNEERRQIRRLKDRIERLEGEVEALESTVEEQRAEIAEYETELSETRRAERKEVRERRAVSRLERERDRLRRERTAARERVEELEAKLDQLKQLWRIDHDDLTGITNDRGLVVVKPVAQFTAEALREAEKRHGMAAGDVIYLRDASGAGRSTAERLAETDPQLVVRTGGLSDAADEVLFEEEIPVAPAEAVDITEVDDLAVARETVVEAAVTDWQRRAEERRQERTAEMVDQVITEHRADRSETEAGSD